MTSPSFTYVSNTIITTKQLVLLLKGLSLQYEDSISTHSFVIPRSSHRSCGAREGCGCSADSGAHIGHTGCSDQAGDHEVLHVPER